MKRFIFFAGLVFALIACSTQKHWVKIEKNGDTESVEDSLEYELIVLDPEFDTWYSIHGTPVHYHSQQYYESWNRQYVQAWNAHASDPQKSSFFEPIVGWYPTEDYGFELNHKLFYYFQYVENVLNIQIIPHGPRGAGY